MIRETPYWWEAAKPEPCENDLPRSVVDVAVIGAGYTGLNAAITLAKSGKSVTVLDTELPGFGASSRNGGMVGNLLKPGVSGLMKTFGKERGVAIAREAISSIEHTRQVIEGEQIDCDFSLNGRLYPAVLQKHLKSMAVESENRVRFLDAKEEVLDPEKVKEDVGSSLYVGGVRQYETGGLHPAKYAKGLATAAIAASACVIAPCKALGLAKTSAGFDIKTDKGKLKAAEVLIATNGYGGNLVPYLQNRIMPIGSTMIATEELDPDLVSTLFPTNRVIADSRKMLSYYRPSPDGKRVLLGGRPSIFPASAQRQASILKSRLTEIFPALEKAAVSHVWSGYVAYGFDALPVVGVHEGLHFAMGYTGSGVAMSGYLGHKAALQILGKTEGETAFNGLPFPGRFYYNGNPWFVPLAMIGYSIRDRFGF